MNLELPPTPRISRMRADEERWFAGELYHDPHVRVVEVCDPCRLEGRRTTRSAFRDPLWPVVPVQRWDGVWLYSVCPLCWLRLVSYLKLMEKPAFYLDEAKLAMEIMG